MACCEDKLTMNDILFRDYWDKVYPYLSDRICDVHNFELFGNTEGSLEQYDLMNEIYYMFLYGFIAYNDQELMFKNLYPTAPGICLDKLSVMKEIWNKYSFDCKVDYFKCKHKLDLRDILMSVFGIGTSIGKGIDYMRIENTDNCVPTFKIK